MTGWRALMATDLAAMSRSRLVWFLVVGGAAWAVLLAVLATRSHGQARVDAFEADAATLFLLGGLLAATPLGSTSFVRDAHSGYLGLLVGAGASHTAIALTRVGVRLLTLLAVMVIWWAALEVSGLSIGIDFTSAIGVHAASMFINMSLVLCASALMASLIGAIAAGTFGVMVYIAAQAAVNLKAALDQEVVAETTRTLVTAMYVILPRAIISPMVEDHQDKGITSLAAPELSIHGLDVVVPASHPLTIVWTIAWIVVLIALTPFGLRRRQL